MDLFAFIFDTGFDLADSLFKAVYIAHLVLGGAERHRNVDCFSAVKTEKNNSSTPVCY